LPARVVRFPAGPEDIALVAPGNLPAAARHALPAFGLRVGRSVPGPLWVAGPLWAFDEAASRPGPAREPAQEMQTALRRFATTRFAIAGRRPFELERPQAMAVLNLTPDSFSDGGELEAVGAALEAARRALESGAGFLDVGGESTRPGAEPVSESEEKRRVLPVIEAIARSFPQARISVDTVKASVAREAVSAGASIVNDVSGLDGDRAMAATVAELNVPIILGHRRGDASTMQRCATYKDVVAEVADELSQRREKALQAGVAESQVLLDPGLGFAKEAPHNLEILRRLAELRSLGSPLVVGPSRKSFLGEILGGRPPKGREDATLACVVIAALAGAKVLRIHDVMPAVDALAVVSAVLESASS
jgi:dihydropteroate synthase